MTTPDDPTPKDATSAPAPKKPAAKKAAPADVTAVPKTPAVKPKATSSKPAAKKVAPAEPAAAIPLSKGAMPVKASAAPKATTVSTPATPPISTKTPVKVMAKTAVEAPVHVDLSAEPSILSPAERTAVKPKTKPAAPKTPTVPAKPVAQDPKVASAIVAPLTDDKAPKTPVEAPSGSAAPVIKAAPQADRANIHAAKILKRAAKVPENSDFVAKIKQKSAIYWRLMRMDRPIGTLLLLWPTLWSLWIAAKGVPSIKNLVIFALGVIVMRAAGCVINDFADRKIDGRVERTKDRPLATGAVSSREALGLFAALCLIAFTLVLFTDPFTIKLSVGGLILAFCYPFMKRHTHLPQVVLGAAFAWGIPMAYAAEAGELHEGMWLIYVAVVLWTVAYDTFYAMVDRDDDLKIGVKSTAILFGEQDRLMTGVLQIMALYALMLVGNRFELSTFYYLGLAVAAGLFVYQQWLIRFRARAACFKAFLNNNWVGVAVFVGIVMDYSFR